MSSKTKKELTAQLELYKQTVKNLTKANDELSISIQQALEEKEEWFQHADKAHKENEELVSLVAQKVKETINNLIHIDSKIGSLTVVDIMYNVGMIERRIKAKFNSKTEEKD